VLTRETGGGILWPMIPEELYPVVGRSVERAMKTLLSEKHLYQAVEVETSASSPRWRRGTLTESRGPPQPSEAPVSRARPSRTRSRRSQVGPKLPGAPISSPGGLPRTFLALGRVCGAKKSRFTAAPPARPDSCGGRRRRGKPGRHLPGLVRPRRNRRRAA